MNFSCIQAVSKDLWLASKLKTCPSLQSWSRSVQNALWWCFEHCAGRVYMKKFLLVFFSTKLV
jgi:hypothetical protein